MKPLVQEATTKRVDELTLVGFRVLCRKGEDYVKEIPKAVERLNERKKEIQHLADLNRYFGAFMVDACHPEYDGYWVCMEVNKLDVLPSGMESLYVPSQLYATIPYQGPNTQIMVAYRELHEWIAYHGYDRLLGTWHLEKYEGFPTERTKVDVELYDTIRS